MFVISDVYDCCFVYFFINAYDKGNDNEIRFIIMKDGHPIGSNISKYIGQAVNNYCYYFYCF